VTSPPGGAGAGAIETRRLRLLLLDAEALSALLDGDLAAASRALGVTLPPEFPAGHDDGFLRVQLRRLLQLPERRAWGARAAVTRRGASVVGHCGFHGPPELVGRAEIGYTVFAPYRNRGYATEAAEGLVRWAARQGERFVFASVAPTNLPSLAVVRRLGFDQVGEQVDPEDGLELVFRRDLSAAPPPD
jgi:RimJ/RimL family protein N-acetyltransferase